MVFMNGMYFALRSGDEHRNLRHDPPQIELTEKRGERAYLKYMEGISKQSSRETKRASGNLRPVSCKYRSLNI